MALFSDIAQSAPLKKYTDLLNQIGKAAANALFPNDIEYYFVALELVDSRGNAVDYFSFPIMPSSIRYMENEIANIKKSAGGITALSSTTFVPIDISLSGNFGRSFKFLVGNSQFNANAFRFSTESGNYSPLDAVATVKNAVFDPKIKTGYGCIKVLNAIYTKSRMLDDNNQPHRLYLYNPALGMNHLVKAINLSLSQNGKEENMIWQYNISLKAIAPLSAIKPDLQKSLIKGLAFDFTQKRLTNVLSSIKKSIGR